MNACRCCKSAHQDICFTSVWNTSDSDEELLTDNLRAELGDANLHWFEDLTEVSQAEPHHDTLNNPSSPNNKEGWSPFPKGGMYTQVGMAFGKNDVPTTPQLTSCSPLSSGLNSTKTACDYLCASQMEINWTNAMATPSWSQSTLAQNADGLEEMEASIGADTYKAKPKGIHRQLFSPGQMCDDSEFADDWGDGNLTVETENTGNMTIESVNTTITEGLDFNQDTTQCTDALRQSCGDPNNHDKSASLDIYRDLNVQDDVHLFMNEKDVSDNLRMDLNCSDRTLGSISLEKRHQREANESNFSVAEKSDSVVVLESKEHVCSENTTSNSSFSINHIEHILSKIFVSQDFDNCDNKMTNKDVINNVHLSEMHANEFIEINGDEMKEKNIEALLVLDSQNLVTGCGRAKRQEEGHITPQAKRIKLYDQGSDTILEDSQQIFTTNFSPQECIYTTSLQIEKGSEYCCKIDSPAKEKQILDSSTKNCATPSILKKPCTPQTTSCKKKVRFNLGIRKQGVLQVTNLIEMSPVKDDDRKNTVTSVQGSKDVGNDEIGDELYRYFDNSFSSSPTFSSQVLSITTNDRNNDFSPANCDIIKDNLSSANCDIIKDDFSPANCDVIKDDCLNANKETVELTLKADLFMTNGFSAQNEEGIDGFVVMKCPPHQPTNNPTANNIVSAGGQCQAGAGDFTLDDEDDASVCAAVDLVEKKMVTDTNPKLSLAGGTNSEEKHFSGDNEKLGCDLNSLFEVTSRNVESSTKSQNSSSLELQVQHSSSPTKPSAHISPAIETTADPTSRKQERSRSLISRKPKKFFYPTADEIASVCPETRDLSLQLIETSILDSTVPSTVTEGRDPLETAITKDCLDLTFNCNSGNENLLKKSQPKTLPKLLGFAKFSDLCRENSKTSSSFADTAPLPMLVNQTCKSVQQTCDSRNISSFKKPDVNFTSENVPPTSQLLWQENSVHLTNTSCHQNISSSSSVNNHVVSSDHIEMRNDESHRQADSDSSLREENACFSTQMWEASEFSQMPSKTVLKSSDCDGSNIQARDGVTVKTKDDEDQMMFPTLNTTEDKPHDMALEERHSDLPCDMALEERHGNMPCATATVHPNIEPFTGFKTASAQMNNSLHRMTIPMPKSCVETDNVAVGSDMENDLDDQLEKLLAAVKNKRENKLNIKSACGAQRPKPDDVVCGNFIKVKNCKKPPGMVPPVHRTCSKLNTLDSIIMEIQANSECQTPSKTQLVMAREKFDQPLLRDATGVSNDLNQLNIVKLPEEINREIIDEDENSHNANPQAPMEPLPVEIRFDLTASKVQILTSSECVLNANPTGLSTALGGFSTAIGGFSTALGGFSTAAGKQIQLCPSSHQKAQKLWESVSKDVANVDSVEGNNGKKDTQGIQTQSGTKRALVSQTKVSEETCSVNHASGTLKIDKSYKGFRPFKPPKVLKKTNISSFGEEPIPSNSSNQVNTSCVRKDESMIQGGGQDVALNKDKTYQSVQQECKVTQLPIDRRKELDQTNGHKVKHDLSKPYVENNVSLVAANSSLSDTILTKKFFYRCLPAPQIDNNQKLFSQGLEGKLRLNIETGNCSKLNSSAANESLNDTETFHMNNRNKESAHILRRSEFAQKENIPLEGVLVHEDKTSNVLVHEDKTSNVVVHEDKTSNVVVHEDKTSNVVASVGESDHLVSGLSQPIPTRSDCQLSDVTVTTATWRTWSISESDLQRSNNILEDKENLPSPNITNYAGSPKPVGNNLKQVNSPQQISPHGSMPPHAGQKGFSTAAGAVVSVSDKALKHAKSFFEDNITDSSTSSNHPALQSMGFSTAAGTPVSVSDKALKHTRTSLDDIINSDTSITCDIPRLKPIGFSTAAGKPVSISEEALKHARISFEENKNDCLSSSNHTQIKSKGFSTAAGTPVSVTDEALKHARTSLEDINGNSSTSCDIPKLKPTGFSTSAGTPVSVSDKSLQHARSFLNDNIMESSTSSAPVGFFTAGGTPVSVSDTALKHAGNSFENNKIDGFTSNHPPMQFMGISTAAGTQVSVSDKALKHAQTFLGEVETNNNQLDPNKQGFSLSSDSTVSESLPLDEIAQSKLTSQVQCCPDAYHKLKLLDRLTTPYSLPAAMHQAVITPGTPGSSSNIIKQPQNVFTQAKLNESTPVLARPINDRIPAGNRSKLNKEFHIPLMSNCEEFHFDRKRGRKRLKPVMANEQNDSPPPVSCNPGGSFKPPFKKPRLSDQELSSTDSYQISNDKKSAKNSFVPPSSKVPVDKTLDGHVIPVSQSKKERSFHNAGTSDLAFSLDDDEENLMLCQDFVAHATQSRIEKKNSCEDAIPTHRQESRNSKYISYAITNISLSALNEQTLLAEVKRQESIIAEKKNLRTRPQCGMWMAARKEKRALKNFQSFGLELRTDLLKSELLSLGVSGSTLKINSLNSKEFRFDLRRFYPALDSSILVGDGALLVSDRSGCVGTHEFFRAFLTLDSVDPSLVDELWLENHYRWIVWKLAAYEICFPHHFAGRILTPENVMLQLKYRYDREIDACQRSVIKKCLEGDDTFCKRLVLCVASVVRNGDRQYIVELTDGWYSIKAQLDQKLTDLVARKKIVPGCKLMISGAELVGLKEACSPLEVNDDTTLKIHGNSTRPALCHARLGFSFPPSALCVPLCSLSPGGGTVGCVDVVVARKYPVMYMEKLAEGRYIFLSSEEEERARQKHEEKRQTLMEKMYSTLQSEVELKRKGKKNGHKKLNKKEIEQLWDGQDIAEALDNALNPEELQQSLSSSQMQRLVEYKQTEVDKIQQEIKKQMIDAMSSDSGSVKRNVTPVMKLKVCGCCKTDIDNKTSCIVTVWKPGQEWMALTEGLRYKMYNLSASATRSHNEAGKVSLTATRQTQFQAIKIDDNLIDLCYESREVWTVSELKTRQPFADEFDFVGVVIQLDMAANFVLAADQSRDVLTIKVSSVSQVNNLREGQCFVASNLALCKSSLQNRKSALTAYARPEFTSFSTSGISSRYSHIFSLVEKMSKIPDVLKTMQKELYTSTAPSSAYVSTRDDGKTAGFQVSTEDFPPDVIEKLFSPMSQAPNRSSENGTKARLNRKANNDGLGHGRSAQLSPCENVTDLIQSEILKKKKLILREKMSKLLAYDRPSPLTPLPIGGSPASIKEFKPLLPKSS